MTVVLQSSLSHYDYLIVGAGLTSAVFAHEAKAAGKTCLVIDRRDHIGGNIYTEEIDGINVHKYGAHIFHTSLKPVWEYVNQFAGRRLQGRTLQHALQHEHLLEDVGHSYAR